MENLSSEQLKEEKEKLDKLKLELETKNKQLWAMSETIYKEKKKSDEQLKEILSEKENLEKLKKENEIKVRALWEQSTSIHKEKERINQLKLEIEHRHKEVMDSVNYAKKIQEAILPELPEIFKHVPHSFILFKPRDIVSGDFYWFAQRDQVSILAAVDCTGHGVPGAFMSMIGNTLLNKIVLEKNITDPAEILSKLDQEVNHALKQDRVDSESRDGMDIALLRIDYSKNEICYAGANRPLYKVKNNEIEEIKATKFPIGGMKFENEKVFQNHYISIQPFDTFYISTDGYADQFGGKGKKLMTKKFKDILLSIQDKRMSEQRQYLDEFIEDWKKEFEQTDDILVIGLRI
jgi:serine phosphatase RsbU (regulator of sigma subunit)